MKGFTVYDCKKDIRNILVTPQIRARFCYMEPGSGSLEGFGHTHDLGHEIFIILSGRVEFRINGETHELGPGQMCYALVDEPHTVRAVGDEPVYFYLSVTPHIQPTHTMYTDDGERGRPHFRPSSDYNSETDASLAVEDHIDRYLGTMGETATVTENCATLQRELAAALKKAIAEDDEKAATAIREQMWEPLLSTFKLMTDLAGEWNALCPRVGHVNKHY
jgi:mannose-6-phosphate isomerase-like protein (cupin superfamily)